MSKDIVWSVFSPNKEIRQFKNGKMYHVYNLCNQMLIL